VDDKRICIEVGHPTLTIERQCQLVGIGRASFYRQPCRESPENLRVMRWLDEQYLKTPFYGIRKMTERLRQTGEVINHKRVQRLMRLMGIEGMTPKRGLSYANKSHKIYPYLLRGVKVSRPNQVWSTDITYLRLREGWLYLTAVIDWYSRYVLSWSLSNTMDAEWCAETLQAALRFGGKPDIFNTDQGSQFTSDTFVNKLLENEIDVSMDGKGRALDNVFIERLWRTVKYEEVYAHDYASPREAEDNLRRYFAFYNDERIHQHLRYKTPKQVYFQQAFFTP
jgi:putative transposase